MTPLSRKLSRDAPLSAADLKVVDELQSPPAPVRRNREIVSEGRRYEELFVLQEGFAVRYRILRDGRRQILDIVLPGDVIGFPGCFFERALYSISALSDTTVSRVSFAQMMEMFDRHPRIAAAIFWSFAREAAMFAEHLIDVGRRSALERVAHFLLELLTRLQFVGLADERSYRLPLTQELIGDALGLSVPHVNRTLRQLRDDDLVSIEDHRVVLKNIEALTVLADFEPTYLSHFSFPPQPEPDGA
jgi:CRP-like cAMP-binding protein